MKGKGVMYIIPFANTGKEREATLRFVHDCEVYWGVRVHWLEFVTDLASVGPAGRFEEVGYNSASRNGEPLDRLIARKQALFSTVTGRWCTQFCKVGVMLDFMAAKGFSTGDYSEIIGFRADECDRVYELPRRTINVGRRLLFPLHQAGVRKANIYAFWREQPFDLKLRRGTGNCDHCPFLNTKNRIARLRMNPAGSGWWKQHELRRGFSFGYEGMAEIERMVAQSPLLPLSELEEEAADTECIGWCGSEAA